jgi:histidinol-phosphate aminotransferase
MNTIDRRQWLKTIGLSGGFALLGGLDGLAMRFPARTFPPGSIVKLNANENPYGPSKSVRETLVATFDDACRYPFATLPGLVKMIADKEGVDQNMVVVTGGSTEGLKVAGLVYGLANGEIIAADPTFQALMSYAENFGALVHRVPLNDRLEHDLDAMSRRINGKTRLIFLCNPNNPTGTLVDAHALRDFCTAHEKDAVIFSDEAYYDFITLPEYPSMITLVKEGRNVIVSKTFSKVYGLAGLRIGYLIARPEIANRLKNATMASTNTLAIAAATEALKDTDFYKFSLSKNEEAKSLIYATLEKLNLDYVRSHTNFVFFKSGRPIQSLIGDMQKENVQIGRPFPPMMEWARISTGTTEEIHTFCNALEKVMRT